MSKLILFLIPFALSASLCPNCLPHTFSYIIVSDTSDWCTGPDLPNGGQASITQGNSGWTASIPGAYWIWDLPYVSSPSVDQTVNFIKEFYIEGSPVSGIYLVNGDDKIWTSINGKSINCDVLSNSWTLQSMKTCNVTSFLLSGLNVLQITVTNNGDGSGISGSSSYFGNPAGALYKLSVVSQANGF